MLQTSMQSKAYVKSVLQDSVTSHEFYLTPQMEEVVKIVGAQISCAALRVVHVLKRSVRIGFERIKSAALGVLQRHIDPVEQLRRLVHGGTGLYSRHHIVVGGALRIFWIITRVFSVIPPPTQTPAPRLAGWLAGWIYGCDPCVLARGALKDPSNGTAVSEGGRSGSMKRQSLNASLELGAAPGQLRHCEQEEVQHELASFCSPPLHMWNHCILL